MSRNGNNLGVSVAEVIETDPHKDQNTNTFYDPSNPVLAPAKEITPNKRRNWKRKIIGWGFVALLLVIGGFVLYALLKINHVDVKVLADNRRDSSKPEPDANKSENGLSAEAINIAREAMGKDPATTKPVASPSASPGPDATYRFDYSATVNPGMGPATDFGTTGTSSSQQPVGLAQPEVRTLEHSLTEATLQSRANPTQSIFVDDAPNPVAALPKTSNIKLASSLEDKAASKERTKNSSTVLPPFGTMLPVRTQAVILTGTQ